jgi:hypothetical protein
MSWLKGQEVVVVVMVMFIMVVLFVKSLHSGPPESPKSAGNPSKLLPAQLYLSKHSL